MKRFNWFVGSVIVIGGMVFAPLAFAAGTAGGAGGGGAAGGAGGGNGAGANGAAGGQTGAGGTNASGNNSGNPGTGNPLGASPGGSNPLGTAPGTSPLGSGPGGSNPLGTTQNQGQGARPSTVDPNSSTNDINGHGFNQNNLGTSNAGSGSGAGAGSGIGTSQQQGATGSGVGLPVSSGNGVPSNAQTHYGDEHARSENMNNSRNGLNGGAKTTDFPIAREASIRTKIGDKCTTTITGGITRQATIGCTTTAIAGIHIPATETEAGTRQTPFSTIAIQMARTTANMASAIAAMRI